jgi:hypothetical protein
MKILRARCAPLSPRKRVPSFIGTDVGALGSQNKLAHLAIQGLPQTLLSDPVNLVDAVSRYFDAILRSDEKRKIKSAFGGVSQISSTGWQYFRLTSTPFGPKLIRRPISFFKAFR